MPTIAGIAGTRTALNRGPAQIAIAPKNWRNGCNNKVSRSCKLWATSILPNEMIRRDYILRMIEEFMQALTRIRSAKQQKQWDEASGDLDTEFKRLIGSNAEEALQMSETELLARTVQSE